MTFSSLKKSSQKYRSVFFAEEFLPRRSRRVLEAAIVACVFALGCFFLADAFSAYSRYFNAAFFLLVILFIKLRMLEAFCISREREHHEEADFETLSIVNGSDQSDLIRSLILSRIGEMCLLRAGADRETLEKYILASRVKISAAEFDQAARNRSGFFDLASYASFLVSLDPVFVDILANRSASLENISGAARWISDTIAEERKKTCWWSLESLAADFSHIRHKESESAFSDALAVLPAILRRVPAIESKEGVFFTYPALSVLAERLSCCVVGTIASERAYEILYALPAYAKSLGDSVIRESHVEHFFKKK